MKHEFPPLVPQAEPRIPEFPPLIPRDVPPADTVPAYPEFHVPGVPDAQVWQLFNAGNFPYYCLLVAKLREGVCGFCTIDPAINKLLPFPNDSWFICENTVSTRGGNSAQEHQFVIFLRRHIENIDDLSALEWVHLLELIRDVNLHFGITGGAMVIRSGDPLRNAKSMAHFHVNYHIPTGKERVQVWLAKSEEDLKKKREILTVFEEMRMHIMSGAELATAWQNFSLEKRALVQGLMTSEGRC